jgi:hypothetical protein
MEHADGVKLLISDFTEMISDINDKTAAAVRGLEIFSAQFSDDMLDQEVFAFSQLFYPQTIQSSSVDGQVDSVDALWISMSELVNGVSEIEVAHRLDALKEICTRSISVARLCSSNTSENDMVLTNEYDNLLHRALHDMDEILFV